MQDLVVKCVTEVTPVSTALSFYERVRRSVTAMRGRMFPADGPLVRG